MAAILCFGDSITFGEGCNGGWCGYLKRWFEALGEDNSVYNLGINGQTSSELLNRIDVESRARLRFKRPTDSYTTLMAVGVNDAKYDGAAQSIPRISEEEFRANVLQLLRKAKSFRQKVAMLGLLPVDESKTLLPSDLGSTLANERVTKFNDIIKGCCRSENVPFLDLNRMMLGKDYGSLLEDGLHPNLKGYRFMFARIRAFLKKNSLLPS